MLGKHLTTRLGSIAKIIMGQSPPGNTYNEASQGLPFYQGVVDFGSRYPSRRVYCSAPTRRTEPDDVMLSVRAPIGRVNVAVERCAIGRGLAVVRPHDPKDRVFLEFVLRAGSTHLWSMFEGGGSVFGNARRDDLESLEIVWPPIEERRAIAAILGALDDKIELNRWMNETLEAMAQAVFKSWFVDFDPFRDQGMEDSPLGPIPKGWRVESLGELYPNDSECVITGPFGSTLHAHDYRDSGTPLILVKHVNKGHIVERDVPLVGDHKLSELSRYHLKVGDIVFTRVGAVGRSALIYPRHEGWLISGQMLRVRVQGGQVHPRYLAQLYLTDAFIDMVQAYALGTTRPSLNTTMVQDFRFICPPGSIQQEFAEKVHPLDLKVQHNLIESQTLAAIRDSLLPKLLSGEIRVKDAENLKGSK